MVRTFCPVTTSYLPRGSGDHGLTFSAVVPPQLESHLCPQGLGSRFNRAQAQRTNSSGAQPQLLALYLLSKFLTWKTGLLWICGLGPCGLRCPWGLTTISIHSPCSALTPVTGRSSLPPGSSTCSPFSTQASVCSFWTHPALVSCLSSRKGL